MRGRTAHPIPLVSSQERLERGREQAISSSRTQDAGSKGRRRLPRRPGACGADPWHPRRRGRGLPGARPPRLPPRDAPGLPRLAERRRGAGLRVGARRGGRQRGPRVPDAVREPVRRRRAQGRRRRARQHPGVRRGGVQRDDGRVAAGARRAPRGAGVRAVRGGGDPRGRAGRLGPAHLRARGGRARAGRRHGAVAPRRAHAVGALLLRLRRGRRQDLRGGRPRQAQERAQDRRGVRRRGRRLGPAARHVGGARRVRRHGHRGRRPLPGRQRLPHGAPGWVRARRRVVRPGGARVAQARPRARAALRRARRRPRPRLVHRGQRRHGVDGHPPRLARGRPPRALGVRRQDQELDRGPPAAGVCRIRLLRRVRPDLRISIFY
uniref:Uncharacterized protein n=1 Tax=Zea mays TaxID=4577 RepID=A0A804MUH4_MAIZE